MKNTFRTVAAIAIASSISFRARAITLDEVQQFLDGTSLGERIADYHFAESPFRFDVAVGTKGSTYYLVTTKVL